MPMAASKLKVSRSRRRTAAPSACGRHSFRQHGAQLHSAALDLAKHRYPSYSISYNQLRDEKGRPPGLASIGPGTVTEAFGRAAYSPWLGEGR